SEQPQTRSNVLRNELTLLIELIASECCLGQCSSTGARPADYRAAHVCSPNRIADRRAAQNAHKFYLVTASKKNRVCLVDQCDNRRVASLLARRNQGNLAGVSARSIEAAEPVRCHSGDIFRGRREA